MEDEDRSLMGKVLREKRGARCIAPYSSTVLLHFRTEPLILGLALRHSHTIYAVQ